MGFPLETFVRWLEMHYGPSTVNFNHVQEARNVGGVMRPIPGSDKVFLMITVRFLLRPEHDNIQQSISQKLWELGCRNTAPFAMRCSADEDGYTTAQMSYLMGHIQVV